jgi:hypothetical protein
MKQLDAMWKALRWPGIEHLVLREHADAFVADGALLAQLEGRPLRLGYRVECDRQWKVRRVEIELPSDSRSIALFSDGIGHWRSARGESLPELEGCVDVDIALTPFTNTLPVARGLLDPGDSRDFRVVYLAPPDFRPRAVAQRYTCLERGIDGSRYCYESRSFSAELRFDDNALVLDYPGIWERMA